MISSRFLESSILQVDGLDQSIDAVAFEEIPTSKAIKKYLFTTGLYKLLIVLLQLQQYLH